MINAPWVRSCNGVFRPDMLRSQVISGEVRKFTRKTPLWGGGHSAYCAWYICAAQRTPIFTLADPLQGTSFFKTKHQASPIPRHLICLLFLSEWSQFFHFASFWGPFHQTFYWFQYHFIEFSFTISLVWLVDFSHMVLLSGAESPKCNWFTWNQCWWNGSQGVRSTLHCSFALVT